MSKHNSIAGALGASQAAVFLLLLIMSQVTTFNFLCNQTQSFAERINTSLLSGTCARRTAVKTENCILWDFAGGHNQRFWGQLFVFLGSSVCFWGPSVCFLGPGVCVCV